MDTKKVTYRIARPIRDELNKISVKTQLSENIIIEIALLELIFHRTHEIEPDLLRLYNRFIKELKLNSIYRSLKTR